MQVIQTCTCFFSRSLLSRKYKIQIVAHVGRKSVVVLSGIMEASYPHFFIGLDFDRFSRIRFPPLRSKGGKSILEKWSRESNSAKEHLHDHYGVLRHQTLESFLRAGRVFKLGVQDDDAELFGSSSVADESLELSI